jgi:uncharacterized membrane protein YbhN (UPF0104 family)
VEVDDVRALVDALDAFFSHLAAVSWAPVGIAVVLHVVRLACRVRAWQNIVRAAYPRARVRFRSMFGAYVAGVGVNSIAPARGGDVVKLYIAHRRVEGARYPTLASTLLAETVLDMMVAGVLFLWAVQQGVLPGVPDLPGLPAFDWSFVVRHPQLAAVLGSVLLAAVLIAVAHAQRHVQAFWAQVKDGLVILRDRRAYLTQVATWQLASWGARISTVVFFLQAFHLDSSPRTALTVIVVMSLSTLLPFTPGGVGTQQAVLAFVLAGTASTSAVLSFSIGMQVVITVVNVALGFAAIGLMLRTLRWRRHARGPGDEALNAERAAEPSR